MADLRWFCIQLILLALLHDSATSDELGPNLASLNRCGPYALHACALSTGRETTTAEIDELFPSMGEVTSLRDLAWGAEQLGLKTLAVRWRRDPPAFSRLPAIIPILNAGGTPHFVAMLESQTGRALILDIPHRPGWVRFSDLRDKMHWDGHALHVAREQGPLDELRSHTSSWSSTFLISLGAAMVLVSLLSGIQLGGPHAD